MREILISRQSLKMKLLRSKFEYRKSQLDYKKKQLAINICLFIGFKNNIMDITLDNYQSNDKYFIQKNLDPKKTIYIENKTKNL